MRLPQKGNWVKIDSDNLGNFNPLVDNQFCRGVLVCPIEGVKLEQFTGPFFQFPSGNPRYSYLDYPGCKDPLGRLL